MKSRILVLAGTLAIIAGCHHNDDDNNVSALSDEATMRYSVSVSNLTVNQPMSPLAILTHTGDYSLFEVGSAASVELEYLAEGGSNAELIALMESNNAIEQGLSGNGLLLPGASDRVEVTLDSSYPYLSVASMLVNTNDAFVGETGISVSGLAVGESYSMNMSVWDSGTEANDELAATIPGPAGGGEGFNADRNDDDRVAFHSGVISQDDGLASSILSANHRFLNPGAQLVITRIE
ncbi:spondin domain-containing protein [Vibrio agarivorans]|uniref:spondin domain-containing protein n=1 Tax=Vibrio agarivorans TaxID=153622 RepID=UPI0022322974|nr:spondin domain-containing protein [Vibrio agarivorans]